MTDEGKARKRRRGAGGPTIAAVAKHAGVSAMTVSNVLNDKAFVNSAAREAVLAAVQALNYTPNSAARTLAAAGLLRIGLLHHHRNSALLSAMLVGTLRATARLGVQLILQPYDDADPMSGVENILRVGVDGLLLPPPLCEAASATGLPERHDTTMVALAPGDDLRNMDCVRIDDEQASYELTRILLQKGHRHIAFVILPQSLAGTTRLRGYLRALGEAGVAVDMGLVWEARPTFEAGLALAECVVPGKRGFTAVIAGNDDMAAAFVNVALRNALSIPADLSITGFDDTPIAEKIWPPLTTVHQPLALIAEKATEHIASVLRGDDVPARREAVAIHVDFSIVERQSVDSPPA
jgi:LacI family transcriptional regulator